MKSLRMFGSWLVLAGLGLSTAGAAPKEQWLQYHTSREGRGYRWLQLSTNVPAGVPLPKCNAQPYFVRWTTPLDPKGRWVCFDRTRKAGPYDLVYVDSTGNGRLDDKPPLKANRIEDYYAYFDPARVVFKGEDGPITYHLSFQFMKYDSDRVNAMVQSGGYYAGLVDFGGRKKRVELIDANVNGVFNDQGAYGECDQVQVQVDKAGERYLGRMLEVEEQLYRIEIATDGAFLKLEKLDDVVFGQVQVPEAISQFVAYGENGHFVRKPEKGQFKLPVGKYQIVQWRIDRKDSKGASWRLEGENFPESARLEVTAQKAARLEIGEPVRAVMEPTDRTNQVDFSLSFKGRQNETVSVTKGTQNPPGPKLALASLDGTYRVTNTFEFG